jgi:hypothetical protein
MLERYNKNEKYIYQEWEKDVYYENPIRTKWEIKQWRKLRSKVLKRDENICLRCEKKFVAKNITAHHLIPRSEGGIDDINNLVTLCNSCHDYVETEGLKTIADIIGSYLGYISGFQPIPEAIDKDDWRTWVYGGFKKPRKANKQYK